MDEDFVKSLILSAKSQYDRTQTWIVVLVTVAVISHLMIHAPYVGASKQLAEAEEQRSALSERSTRVDSIGSSLSGLRSLPGEKLEKELEGALETLQSDFHALDVAIERVRSGVDEPSRGSAIQSAEPIQLQQPLRRQPRALTDLELPTRIEEELRAGADLAKLRSSLRPFVSDSIVQPTFAMLNERWVRLIAPELSARVGEVRDEVVAIAGELPDYRDNWNAILEALTETEDWVVAYRFVPPADSLWWTTVEDKWRVLSALGDHLISGLGEALAPADDVTEIEAALRAAALQQDSLARSLRADLEATQARVDALTESVSGIGGALRFVAADLELLAVRFPLLLGLLLGFVSALSAYRKRALAITVGLLPDDAEEKPAVERLYKGVSSPVATPFGAAQTGLLQAILLTLAGWVWIALATWPLLPIRCDSICGKRVCGSIGWSDVPVSPSAPL